MKNLTILLSLLALLLAGCAPASGAPRPVHKSLYLNKRLMKFVMDNGPAYKERILPGGHTLHYWRSDSGGLIAIATGRDDRFPDYCEVALETDEKQIVRRIFIVEDSVICNGVLK